MDIGAYFDSVASFWDDDFSEAKPARIVAAAASIPRGGASVLDIGCGSGSMFLDLLEAGACEIEGVDISKGMTDVAREKYGFDKIKRMSLMANQELTSFDPLRDNIIHPVGYFK